MGFFGNLMDSISGTKRPDEGTTVQPVDVVKQAILSLNRDTAPYIIRDGGAEGVDLVAEWKIVDAKWYEIFAKAGLKRVFKILMKFDQAKSEVRAVDQELKVSWEAGIPTITKSVEAFRGQKKEISFGNNYAFTEELVPGEIYKYKFDTSEIKEPIQEVILENGWTYKAVSFGSL
jgi:hypothetical protein